VLDCNFASRPLPTETSACLPQAYTLRRLVRGLASNRQGARQGFALALTTIVQQADGVSTAACIGLMEKLHTVSNSMSVRAQLASSTMQDNLTAKPGVCRVRRLATRYWPRSSVVPRWCVPARSRSWWRQAP